MTVHATNKLTQQKSVTSILKSRFYFQLFPPWGLGGQLLIYKWHFNHSGF